MSGRDSPGKGKKRITRGSHQRDSTQGQGKAFMVSGDAALISLGERLAEMTGKGLGSRSAWALRAALDAAETEGIAGVLVLMIPSKSRDYTDVSFTLGTVDIVSRWNHQSPPARMVS